MYSKTITVGRLTRDPEQKQAGQSTVTRFSVAYDEGFGDKKKTHFVNVAAWGKQGESVFAYTKKGTIVVVEGQMISSKSNDTTYWELRADNVKFLPSGDKVQNAAPQQQQQSRPPAQQQQPQYTPQIQPTYTPQPTIQQDPFGAMDIADDSLPF